jgi:hypothetical protein
MQASELDKAVEYTKQFIEAAMPIAKRAYEIGLLTLRIDAVQVIVSATAFLALGLLVARRVRSDWIKAKALAASPENKQSYTSQHISDHLPGDGMLHFFAMVGSMFAIGGACIGLFNIWLWVKLVSPELWLAHRAIEKVLN